MSASTKTNAGLSARCSRLVARPVAKLSSPTTVWPSASRRSTSVDPMKPAAPVTSARTGPPYRRVVVGRAVALVAVQLVIRAVLAFRWLLLLGRPDSDRQGRHPGPAVAVVPVRRPRRPRDAGRLPGRRGDHPVGAAGVDGSGDQPGGAAAAGLAGAVARAARHPRLAAGAADPADVRAVHAVGRAGVRLVGGGAELAADAGRAGVGRAPTRSCWCAPATSATR